MLHRKTKGMLAAEQRLRRPIEQVIRELYVEKDLRQADVAAALGVSGPTLSIWMLKLGIQTRRWALPSDELATTVAEVA